MLKGEFISVYEDKSVFTVYKTFKLSERPQRAILKATAAGLYFAEVNGKRVGEARGEVEYRHTFDIELSEIALWSVGEGNLYDVTATFGEDEVQSYFGFRIATYQGRKFMLNGKSVFQRLVLDQGYYADGIYTAKDAAQFAHDIALSKALGFNGARLHQKVFEQRFLYECDKAGYLVWCEFPSWGMKCDDIKALGVFVSQWSEVVEQYFNHPSIITWCPLNEAWSDLDNAKLVRDVRFVEAAYNVTKSLDPTRPCVDASGGYHGRYTDIFDFHNYHSGAETVSYIEDIKNTDTLTMDTVYAPDSAQERILYDCGLPLNASEYGGMLFAKSDDDGWGVLTAEDPGEPAYSYIYCQQETLKAGQKEEDRKYEELVRFTVSASEDVVTLVILEDLPSLLHVDLGDFLTFTIDVPAETAEALRDPSRFLE